MNRIVALLVLSMVVDSSYASEDCISSIREAQVKNMTTFSPTHCRISGPVQRWPIKAISSSDLESGPNRNWEIVHDYATGTESPKIRIGATDRFKIASTGASGEMQLEHYKKGQADPTASALIKIDSVGKLWARGRAKLRGANDSIGEYYVFRIPDNHHNVSQKCMHSKGDITLPCSTLHFEYFEDDDDDNIQEKPVLDYNVIKITEEAPRSEKLLQTGDGDGDNGPDN